MVQVHVGHDAHIVDHLVGYVFEKFLGIFYADNISVVVDTDIQGAALGVGEAANPFKVFVLPGLLVFHILRFHTPITTFATIYCIAYIKPTARK